MKFEIRGTKRTIFANRRCTIVANFRTTNIAAIVALLLDDFSNEECAMGLETY